MEAITVDGLAEAALQITGLIGSRIQGLHALKGKFDDADTTIRQLISQLSTLKAALAQICDWAEFNSDNSPNGFQFLRGLHVALDGCQAVMDVLLAEVKALTAPQTPLDSLPSQRATINEKKIVWNDVTMKEYERMLSGQVQALQLLLTAGQCPDETSQSKFLCVTENKKLLQDSEEDLRSLRKPKSSHRPPATPVSNTVDVVKPLPGRITFVEEPLAPEDLFLEEQEGPEIENPDTITDVLQEAQHLPEKSDATAEVRPEEVPLPESPDAVKAVLSESKDSPEKADPSEQSPQPESPEKVEPPTEQLQEQQESPEKTDLTEHSPEQESPPTEVDATTESPRQGSPVAATSAPLAPPPIPPVPRAPTDEGYETASIAGSRRSRKWSTYLTIQGKGKSDPSPLRERKSEQNLSSLRKSIFPSSSEVSSSDSIAVSEPLVRRRWFSTSKLQNSTSATDDFPGSSKKFWSLRISRMSRKPVPKTDHVAPSEPRASPLHVWKRNKNPKKSQATVFNSVEGEKVPPLVKAAQNGSRADLEALLNDGENLEAADELTKRTALAVACHCGNTDAVKFLIERKAKLNCRDGDLSTPLHLAASRGHVDAIVLLLNELVSLEARDSLKRTPLWIAAEGGHTKVVDLLLKKGSRVKTRAKNQLTPLHTAAKGGHVETVDFLLRNNSHIETRDIHFMTALHYACENGHLEVVDLLIRKGADIGSVGKDSKHPLMFAAASGQIKVVTLLLKKKANLQSTDEKERNALHWAAMYGRIEVMEFLLERKLSIQAADADGFTPIHLAVMGSHADAVEFLLKKNVKVDARCRIGRTPLHYACEKDNPDVVRHLLDVGANAEAQTRGDNRRPLHIAATSGSVEIIHILHQHGVMMNARDSAGHRALCVACYHGQIEVVKTFLALNQPLTTLFRGGPNHDSPLCVAAWAGHVKIVELLLARGASVTQKNEHGNTPLHYAAHYGHPEVLDILICAGAELQSDGEDVPGGLPMRHRIGFADDVSDERKRKVRELLVIAETKTTLRARMGPNSRASSMRGRDSATLSELPSSPLPPQQPISELPTTSELPSTSELPLTSDTSSTSPLANPNTGNDISTNQSPKSSTSTPILSTRTLSPTSLAVNLDSQPPKSPTSIFSSRNLLPPSPTASTFSTKSAKSTKSLPATSRFSVPVPPLPSTEHPPLPTLQRPNSFHNLHARSPSDGLATLPSQKKMKEKETSLRPAKSMFSLGGAGFGRHVGDLMSMPSRERRKGKKEEKAAPKREEVKREEIQAQAPVLELGSSEVFEIRGDEVFEMG